MKPLPLQLKQNHPRIYKINGKWLLIADCLPMYEGKGEEIISEDGNNKYPPMEWESIDKSCHNLIKENFMDKEYSDTKVENT